jgi:CRISPR/Cas system CSM-associated protein Csm3 (group 7 of RAMP superfamily)
MKNENKNPVVKRIAVKVDCEFASPALIGTGYGENTDNDVLRDSDGKPFLPGSTVAGVLRSLLPGAKSLFGEDDRMSPLWVLDAELAGKIIALDGVALDRENKVALDEKKYDYEAIVTGAKFTLRLLLTIRANDKKDVLESCLKKLIGALQSGCVSFGAKTRRGFGRVKCVSAFTREFDLAPGNTDVLNAWTDFDWANPDGWRKAESEAYDADFETLIARLKLDGSIMIRATSNIYEGLDENEEAPDYKHISVGGKPVILGTSWAGAVRSGLYRLLVSKPKPKLGDGAKEYLKTVFGTVEEADKDKAERIEVSRVTFGASMLEARDTKTQGYRAVTRVKIDRFTGGAADGALFTEKPWYGGETTLEIRYPKGQEDIRELLVLALDGIDKGLIQIGGESAVGRGFFKVTSVNGSPLSKLTEKPKESLIAAIQKAGVKSNENRL